MIFNQRWFPIVAFFVGFLFDVTVLRRIDELNVILQQAAYLVIAGTLIGVDVVEETREVSPPKILKKAWKYRELVLHFLLGTLLNSYAIFYFKSASALTSFLFIGILILVLVLNEFKRFGKSQTQVHVAFISLCLISYFTALLPIILGFIGTIPFLCAVAASAVVFYLFYSLLKRQLSAHPKVLRTHVLFPFTLIQVIFVGFYFLHFIPPVPLSVKYMGIYHHVQKTNEGYELAYTRTKLRFWEHGDQTFEARAGDVIYCYAQIFSPTRFKDQLWIRWLFKDQKGNWQSADAIPIPVTGGREEGFRAVSSKNNYQAGSWRVQIETQEHQEVGRIDFEVISDESIEERELRKEIR